MSAFVKIGKGKAVHVAENGAGRTTNPRTACCGKLWTHSASEGEDVTCKGYAKLVAKQDDARVRLEYATQSAETQDEIMSQAQPVAEPELPATSNVFVMDGPRGEVTAFADSTATVNEWIKSGRVHKHTARQVPTMAAICPCGQDTPPTAEDAGYQETDTISDAMTETSSDDAPYGAVDASLVDDETRERALYDGDAFEFSTGRREPIVDAPVTTWRMIDSTTGEMIKPGTDRKDFRGETWRIVKISCTPETGKTGKVMATDGKGWTREYYPSVFGLVITDREITPDMAGTWLDSWHDWHNSYRVIDHAVEFGFQVPGEYYTALQEYRKDGGADMSDDDYESITGQGGLSDMATEFLNNRAPQGYSFEWNMGELGLWKDTDPENPYFDHEGSIMVPNGEIQF